MRICVDFDETLFPTLEKALEIYNKKYNDNITIDQIITYNIYECLPEKTANNILNMFYKEELYTGLRPYKNATHVLKNLSENNDIFIATASDFSTMLWKEQLIKQYFPFIPTKNIIKICDKELLMVDILIEDNIDTLIKHHYAERVCIDRPWNHYLLKDYAYNIFRAEDWSEMLNIINKIKKEL